MDNAELFLSEMKDKLYSSLCLNLDKSMKKSKFVPKHSSHTSASSYVSPKRKYRKTMNSSFLSITREIRDQLSADNSPKPCLGQYNPKYSSIRKKDFMPFVRKRELNIALDGRVHLNGTHSPQSKSQLCQRI